MILLKKIAAVVFVLIVVKLLVSIYFNTVYYRIHPTEYTQYETKSGYAPGFDPTPNSDELVMTPPIGGCVTSCSNGQTEKVSCDYYSKAYDKCEYRCYGYVYDSCKGTGSLIHMLIVR